jgi:hypothetical protein
MAAGGGRRPTSPTPEREGATLMLRKWPLLLAGTVVGFVTGVIVMALGASSRSKPDEPQPPQIGGQKAPSLVREIDFDKRYDAHCSFFEKEPTVFPGCKVVGFTGPARPQKDGESGGSGYGFRAFSQHFDRWLVLELRDGRQVFVPSNSLRYLETAKVQ